MIKCLIVDDIEENLCIMEAFLRGKGYEIMTACNGVEALEKARANPPDIIVSDLLMPVMDGFTLCKEWKKDEHLKDIPFVVFTAEYTEPNDEEFSLNYGADRFIIKPQKPEILMNVLKEVLEERCTIKPVATKPLGEEMEFFRQYNDILFKELEKKMLDLELSNQKLRISEEELRLHSEILAHMVESVHLVRADDGVIVYTNQRFDSVYGYDPGELVGKHVSMINAPGEKSPESVANEIISSLQQSGVWSGEVHNIRKDGHSFWCYANVSTFKHPQYGEVWISVNRDITERKQAEEALRESEESYRSLFENANEAIIVGQDGKLVFSNPMTAILFGYRREELASRPFVDFLHPDDRDMVFDRHVRRVNGEDIPKRYSFRIIHRDGGIKWVELNAVFINWIGKPATLNFLNDITARKQAEEALRASEEKYRYLVENINDAIFTLNKEGRFTYISPVIERVLGYSPEAFIGHPFSELIYPEDLPLVITAFNNVQSGILKYNDYRIFDKSGRIHWIRSSSRPNYINGNADGVIGIAVDITEQKRVEEELLASQQQLRALTARLQKIREESRITIAREIHDELGGGLTGLKIELSRLLRKSGDADRGEKRVALMEGIQTSNTLIDEMIRVVRRISTELRPSVLDDLGLIAALEGHLQEFTKNTEIQHEFVTSLENVNLEEATATAVFRIFQETLTNVARHSGATKITVILQEENGCLFLEIKDNGRGITEAEIQNPKALGILGMRERALVFGGTLSVSGAQERGTTVILKIPQKQGEPS